MSVATYDISTLENYLEYLRMRPLMILNRKEIDLLDANIQGYTFGNSSEADNSENFLKCFGDFVVKEYGMETSSEGWRSAILRKTNNDQERAFDEFFTLFERYKKRK